MVRTCWYQYSTSNVDCRVRGVEAILTDAGVVPSWAELSKIARALGTVFRTAARISKKSNHIALERWRTESEGASELRSQSPHYFESIVFDLISYLYDHAAAFMAL